MALASSRASPVCVRRTLEAGRRSCACGEQPQEEVQVRRACASVGVRLRAGMKRRAGEGLLFPCGKGITAPFSPCSGPQIRAGVEESCPPPPPPALYSPEFTVITSLEHEGGGRAEVSEGAAAMLGSGKTPGSNPREDRRTAEPGKRLGKKTFKIQSVDSHRHRHQTRHNYAAI